VERSVTVTPFFTLTTVRGREPSSGSQRSPRSWRRLYRFREWFFCTMCDNFITSKN